VCRLNDFVFSSQFLDFSFKIMHILRDATLLFLIKDSPENITDICLAKKKRGFGLGRWNGVGGKVGDKHEETIEEAAKREAREEIGVQVSTILKVAELAFSFPKNPDWNQFVHVYLSDIWTGKPRETEEMKPQWYTISDIPYTEMWPDDEFWLPPVLSGKYVKASFSFGENDRILSQEINLLSTLS
jgi:8-oxo-dGTP pyrophosphatase MutT (NUDIX family)